METILSQNISLTKNENAISPKAKCPANDAMFITWIQIQTLSCIQ